MTRTCPICTYSLFPVHIRCCPLVSENLDHKRLYTDGISSVLAFVCKLELVCCICADSVLGFHVLECLWSWWIQVDAYAQHPKHTITRHHPAS